MVGRYRNPTKTGTGAIRRASKSNGSAITPVVPRPNGPAREASGDAIDQYADSPHAVNLTKTKAAETTSVAATNQRRVASGRRGNSSARASRNATNRSGKKTIPATSDRIPLTYPGQ